MTYIIATAEEMRAVDRAAIEEFGMPGVALMENAGAGTAMAICEFMPEIERAAIICGSGNNGGDGYVIARHLIGRGIDAVIYMMASRDRIRGDALINLEILEKMKAPVIAIEDEKDMDMLADSLLDFDIAVDAMLGTGLTENLRGNYATCVEILNSTDIPVCAVDIPSGLSSDTGQPLGDAVVAEFTCAYGLLKIGQVVYPGADYVGKLVLIDIGLPINVIERLAGPKRLIGPDMVADIFPERGPEAHKGSFGHLLVMGASPGKTGAVCMAAEAAVRSGAGLVTAAVPASLNPVIEAKLTEAMSLPLDDGGSGFLAPDGWESLGAAISKASALAIGPGMDSKDESKKLFFRLLAETSLPMVIDADGLNILAGDIGAIKPAGSRTVLTPHPGEMARLLGTTTAQVQNDRIGAARELADKTRSVVVLKGARSIVAAPDGAIAVNPTGNPGMASGGTGDVLTGVIGALLAQGAGPFEAACAGTWIHGRAGDIAAIGFGETAMKAGDIVDTLPDVFIELTADGEVG